MGSVLNASASADVTMEFMAIVNIVVILLLGGIAIKVLNHYEQQKREGKEPDFWKKKSDYKELCGKNNYICNRGMK